MKGRLCSKPEWGLEAAEEAEIKKIGRDDSEDED